MKQYGFFFDAENCVGCHTCHVACKDVNNLAVGENYRTVRTFLTGSGYTPRMYHLSMACNHCAEPACVAACAAGALIRDERGLIQVDEASCTGCGDCVSACPYSALFLDAQGKAAKCDGCKGLLEQGEEAACVASCPQRVLEFGPVDELRSAHASLELVADAAPLPSSALTQPNLLMRVKDCMDDEDFDEIVI